MCVWSDRIPKKARLVGTLGKAARIFRCCRRRHPSPNGRKRTCGAPFPFPQQSARFMHSARRSSSLSSAWPPPPPPPPRVFAVTHSNSPKVGQVGRHFVTIAVVQGGNNELGGVALCCCCRRSRRRRNTAISGRVDLMPLARGE